MTQSLVISDVTGIILESDSFCSITLNTLSGQICVLPNHEPIMAVLLSGDIVVNLNNPPKFLLTDSRFIEAIDSKTNYIVKIKRGLLNIVPHQCVIMVE